MIRASSLLVAMLGLLSVVPSASAINTVMIEMDRIDDYFFPGKQFGLEVDIEVPDVTGVTGVSVSYGGLGGPAHPLLGPTPSWSLDGVTFADLAAMKSALTGAWTITVSGSSPSTTTFTLDLSPVVDTDFFATPTNLSPADGATNVAPGVTLSWTDPTGLVEPVALSVGVDDGQSFQEAVSIFGGIAVTDTSWPPPLALSNGVQNFFVSYLNVTDGAQVPIPTLGNVTSGTMTWDTDPAAITMGYPANAALILLGGSTAVHFTVPEPAAAAQALAALLALGGLARWRARSV